MIVLPPNVIQNLRLAFLVLLLLTYGKLNQNQHVSYDGVEQLEDQSHKFSTRYVTQ